MFVLYATSSANTAAQKSNRKTITGGDVISAMSDMEFEKVTIRAEKSTYLTTVRLDPSWDILNLRANFQRNQKFSYFLRAVTSLFHDIRTGNCMYNHIGYKESCLCND